MDDLIGLGNINLGDTPAIQWVGYHSVPKYNDRTLILNPNVPYISVQTGVYIARLITRKCGRSLAEARHPRSGCLFFFPRLLTMVEELYCMSQPPRKYDPLRKKACATGWTTPMAWVA